jgi:hypothetical protein
MIGADGSGVTLIAVCDTMSYLVCQRRPVLA